MFLGQLGLRTDRLHYMNVYPMINNMCLLPYCLHWTINYQQTEKLYHITGPLTDSAIKILSNSGMNFNLPAHGPSGTEISSNAMSPL